MQSGLTDRQTVSIHWSIRDERQKFGPAHSRNGLVLATITTTTTTTTTATTIVAVAAVGETMTDDNDTNQIVFHKS